ncbi:MAG: acyl-CoA thioesterase [Deltaproteobacteria bacterium]|nr:acyl-CoA thioesterase [Candidatus Zymogenaceae bacterium]
MTDKLEDYPVVVTIPVAWGEMDALGHVNNIVYFRYFETARMRYLERAGLIDIMKQIGIGPILARTCCTYRVPIYYPDTLTVGTRVSTIGNTHFNMDYLIVSERHGAAAEGDCVVVTFDYRAKGKASVPEAVIRAIEGLEGCPPGSKCVVEELDI